RDWSVTGVQTCALPISNRLQLCFGFFAAPLLELVPLAPLAGRSAGLVAQLRVAAADFVDFGAQPRILGLQALAFRRRDRQAEPRSEERRVGKGRRARAG